MSESDKRRAFNKLKHDLEPWRNILVSIHSFLIWEKNFYPAIVLGVISFIYLLLWILDLSIITMLAIVGLFLVTGDYLYATLSLLLFNANNWNIEQEAQFDRVLNIFTHVKNSSIAWFEYIFNEKKSTKINLIISVLLLSVAYIGAIFNNLLLMYIMTIVLAMYPGIQERNIVDMVKEKMGCAVKSKLQLLNENEKKFE